MFFVWPRSMDGFRVVNLESVLPQIGILIAATGTVELCCAVLSLTYHTPASLYVHC